ncbi:hypothetical protein [Thermus sp.]|uniref:hypothetical protein n=1 Tax=Thermus sp. TaxID=275 RepID=UPI00298F090D|nr:hypothetical protein [Thermus sp.]MDW8358797.1 hypothetical protein [Thermus sp.]
MRRFRQLLQEALEAQGPLGPGFLREARAQARLGPAGEDPVAQSLALGRRALVALAEGQREEARRLLEEAVRLHSGLGGGLALELAARLTEEAIGEALELRALQERERRGWEEEAPPGLRLLRALGAVPSSWWRSFWQEEPPSPRAKQSPLGRRHPEPAPPFTRRERPPAPPTLRLPLRYHRGEEPERMYSLSFLQRESFRPRSTFEEPGEWRSPEGALRLDGEGRLTVRMDRLGAWGGLLVLRGGRSAVILPLPWEAPTLQGWIPLPAEPGEEVEALVWTWESITPATLGALLSSRRSRYPRRYLFFWLQEAVARGLADPEEWADILHLLGSAS